MQAVGLLAGGDRPRFQQSSNRDDRFLRSPPATLSARITSVLRCYVNQTEGQSRGLLGESIELNVVHGLDLGYFKVDQGQLEQVIINLAVNARNAMQDSGLFVI